MLKLLKLVASVLLVAAPAAAPVMAWAKPPVWIVRDADSTIVLFGSVHVLDKGRDWRPKALDEALARADDLWFEIPLDDAAQLRAQQMAIAQGLLPPGKSLRALLSKSDQRRLIKAAQTYRLPLDSLDRLKPWMADITLTSAFFNAQGGLASEGVEQTLERDVPNRVARRAFERPEEQVAMLAGESEKAQLAGLRETLRSLNADPGEYRRMLELWMKGDATGLEKEAVAPLKQTSPETFATLITRRNQNWVGQIEQRLRGSGVTVMVVGAGHLVGKGGVPSLLRARGLKVEGP